MYTQKGTNTYTYTQVGNRQGFYPTTDKNNLKTILSKCLLIYFHSCCC